jgi:hypothetical protein
MVLFQFSRLARYGTTTVTGSDGTDAPQLFIDLTVMV